MYAIRSYYVRRYARRDAVFREGDRAAGFFIVVSGNVKICKTSEDGKEQILHRNNFV